jgi:hypothetical protein
VHVGALQAIESPGLMRRVVGEFTAEREELGVFFADDPVEGVVEDRE